MPKRVYVRRRKFRRRGYIPTTKRDFPRAVAALRSWHGRVMRARVGAPLVHAFRRKIAPTGLALAAGDNLYGYTFALSDVPSVGDYTALYDQFRLNMVVLRFVWRSTQVSALETSNNAFVGPPSVVYVVDRDDASAPASANEVREYARSKEWFFSVVIVTGKQQKADQQKHY